MEPAVQGTEGTPTTPATTPTTPATPPSAQGTPATDGEWSQERAKATIEAQRASEAEAVKNAKALAKERDDLKAKLDALDAEKLSESEKLAKQVQDLTTKLTAAEEARQRTAIRASVLVEAARLEIIDPEGALLMLPSVGQVELSDDGEPSNVPALLAALVKAKPYLLKPSPEGTQANGTPAVKAPERIPATPRANGTGNLPTESDEQRSARERAFARRI